MQWTTLVFDAGNTLIEEIPGAQGPMVTWPVLRPVPGIQAALDQLSARFQLVVGSNAQDSSEEQIYAALKRVGLEGFFSTVFLAPDLGAAKPEKGFFRAIEQRLNASPHELVMIGDSYANDMLGSARAGWGAVWLNTENRAAPGLRPLHDIEINHPDQLAQALEKQPLPGYQECLVLNQLGQASLHLLQHVEMVAGAAYQLALWLRGRGERVDPILAHRGGMTHDIAKMASNRVNELDHGLIAAERLSRLGQPELSEIARRHSLFNLIDPERSPRTWEEKVVYLADKLVEGSRYCSVAHRLAALIERYQIPEEVVAPLRPALRALEEEICQAAGIQPQELAGRLSQAADG